MKCQDLFAVKNDRKKIECCLLQILFGTSRVKIYENAVIGVQVLIFISD